MNIYGLPLFSALPSVLASSDLFLCKRRCFKYLVLLLILFFHLYIRT